jgi:magnesium transporter
MEGGRLLADGLDALDGRATRPVWVDVHDPDPATFERLARTFGLHPLAVEDCLHFPQRPKIDAYEQIVFLVWLVPAFIDGIGLDAQEVDIFLGRDVLITSRREPIRALDEVAARAADVMPRGVAWVLHAILDRAVDDIFPVVERISDELESLEDAMLDGAQPEHLQRLYRAKRTLLALHKIVVPERDVIRGLVRLESYVDAQAYLYFQDVGDHLARMIDSIETYRDVASGVMDIYLSAQSNRMNAIMKQLTVIATIFMPLTLISGIYGMNFHYMPELSWRWGYFAVLAVMAVIAAGMVWYFRRRDWW